MRPLFLALLVAIPLLPQTRADPSQIRGVPLSGPNPILSRRVSETDLSVGWNCTPAQPCQLRLAGGWTAIVDRPWSVRIIGPGDGRVRIYLAWDGLLYVAVAPSTLPVSCIAGTIPCHIATLIERPDSYAIAEWQIAGGHWAPEGRLLSVPVVAYAITGSPVPLDPVAPRPGAICISPRLAFDGARLFLCASGRWKFTALSDW